MSYNGIGLSTTRGSATNGYVQRNLSHLRPRDEFRNGGDDFRGKEDRVRHRQPDEGILEHERKRKVELRCMELRMELEEKDVGDEEIEEQVASLRSHMLESLSRQQQQSQSTSHGYGGYSRQEAKALRPSDTHAWGAAKAGETEKLSKALGIRQGYQEGDAFDHGVQERLKQERIEERKRRDEERVRVAQERERAHRERREEEERWRRRRANEEEERRKVDERPRDFRRSDVSRDDDGNGRRLPRRYRSRSDSLSRSPPHRPRQGARSPSYSRSPSPAPRRRPMRYSDRDSRSPTPPIRRRRARSDSVDSRSRSPPPRRSRARRDDSRSLSRSISPPVRRQRRYSPSPVSKRRPSFSPSRSPLPSRRRSRLSSSRSITHSPEPRSRPRRSDSRSITPPRSQNGRSMSPAPPAVLETTARPKPPGPPPGPPPVRPPGL